MIFATTFKTFAVAALASASLVKAIPAVNIGSMYEARESAAAAFPINIGEDNKDVLAWVGGQSKCTHVTIGPVGNLSPDFFFHRLLTREIAQ